MNVVSQHRRLDLFLRFLKLGLFTLGGGYAMVPLLEREVVDDAAWMNRPDFYRTVLLTQSAPGPVAVNTALVVGRQLEGGTGAFLAALGTIIPSFVIILVIALSFSSFQSYPLVEAAFRGIDSVVVSLIGVAAIRLVRDNHDLFTTIGAVAGFAALVFLNINPFLIVLVFIVAGITKELVKRRHGRDVTDGSAS